MTSQESGTLPVFINSVLLEHVHALSSTCCPWLFSPHMAELVAVTDTVGPTSKSTSYLTLHRRLPASGLHELAATSTSCDFSAVNSLFDRKFASSSGWKSSRLCRSPQTYPGCPSPLGRWGICPCPKMEMRHCPGPGDLLSACPPHPTGHQTLITSSN